MIVHQVIQQRTATDCGITTLAMLLYEQGHSYEDVFLAVSKVDKDGGKKGLFLRQMIAAAKLLGVSLRQRRKYDLDEIEAGILNVEFKGLHPEHVVFVRGGLITETDGTVWEPETYFAAYRAKPKTLLIVAE